MSRSLHATSSETETETTTIINNMMESSVVATNNIANKNKKHASMSSSQIPVLSKVRALRGRSQITLAHWVSQLANLVRRPYLVKVLTMMVGQKTTKSC